MFKNYSRKEDKVKVSLGVTQIIKTSEYNFIYLSFLSSTQRVSDVRPHSDIAFLRVNYEPFFIVSPEPPVPLGRQPTMFQTGISDQNKRCSKSLDRLGPETSKSREGYCTRGILW